MDEVADGLFVGTLEDAGSEALLSEHGIETIVSMTQESPDGGFPPAPSVVVVPMRDGPQNERSAFERAVMAAQEGMTSGEPVLVHCSAGASRSPAVAATALALTTELSLAPAFEQVANRRAAVDPHDALVRQAAHVYIADSE